MYNRSVTFTLTKIVFIIVFVILIASCEPKHRMKRKVVFSKNSKMFFRLNIKCNVIPWVQIFANGWAVRINWDLPDTLHKRYKFFKRDIHSEIDNVANLPGMQGYSCILHYICMQIQAISNSTKCGIFCEIGKIINRSSGVEADFFKSLWNKCGYYKDVCMNLNNVTRIKNSINFLN